ncbi:MAG TPA: Gfo/Idh/MocA family oxidoreductase [Pirellulales bacterium]|nr:Gfo/Idh/MocA family oxidoreductase [Pirellulales bacterium]
MSNEASSQHPTAGSRREFLKLSTASVVGSALAGSLSIARSAHAAGDDTIKIALIGCGGRGTGAANQALSTKGQVKLIAMADAFADRLQSSLQSLKNAKGDQVDVPAERQFVGFDAYQKAIDAGPDLVVLATSPGFRSIHLEAAIKAGKHVFMEKPVAVDGAGVQQVLAATEEAKKKKLAIGVGLQRHHQAKYIETIKRLQDGAIGDLVYSRVYWNGAGVWVKPRVPGESEMTYQMRNWYYFNWLCGDHIVEQHIHNLDVINWLTGKYPLEAKGMGGRQVRVAKEFGQIFDHHAVEFDYGDSTMISQCRHIPNCWDSVSEHVAGTKGTCDISGGRIMGENSWSYGSAKDDRDPYQVEHDVLFESIRSGNPINEGEYGAKSSMTAILGRLATYSGKPVKWEEALRSRVIPADQKYSFDATPPVLPDENGFYPVAIPGVTQVV